MINIDDKSKCCGCTACANICPKSAIRMWVDAEGFLYPVVNLELCVNCGLCNRSCPVENPPAAGKGRLRSFALRTKNSDDLKQSTSGGFFTPLAEYVINYDGVVCAAAYDDDFKIKHIFAEKTAEAERKLSLMRGSKYVQSGLEDCFLKIKGYLEERRLVCFVGTPCQVSGLKAFLQKDYEHLITVDLVCHGVPSPKLWDKYLDYQKSENHSEIDEISFRNKTYGYHSGTMKICFANGKTYYGSPRVDYMLKSFYKDIASRQICYKCPFKTLERCSDFTLYECWHASELVAELKDDNRGYTNVMVQSAKGMQVLEQIRDRYEIYPVDTEKAVKLDGPLILNSAVPHPRRLEFYQAMEQKTMSELIELFIPVTRMDHLLERTKAVIYRLHLTQALKRFKRRIKGWHT